MITVFAWAAIAALFGWVVLTVARVLKESGDVPDALAPAVARLGQLKVWHFVGLGALVIVLASPENAMAVLILLGLLFVVAWFREFLFLMGRRDDEFPGRFDKLVWALALIVTGPLGVLAFRSFRAAHWPADFAGKLDPRATMNPAASAELF